VWQVEGAGAQPLLSTLSSPCFGVKKTFITTDTGHDNSNRYIRAAAIFIGRIESIPQHNTTQTTHEDKRLKNTFKKF
jgi:hypothetical protein